MAASAGCAHQRAASLRATRGIFIGASARQEIGQRAASISRNACVGVSHHRRNNILYRQTRRIGIGIGQHHGWHQTTARRPVQRSAHDAYQRNIGIIIFHIDAS